MDAAKTSLHDFTVSDIDGNSILLGSILKGKKAILVVNVASECGLTADNCSQLTQIHKDYNNQGLEIVGFPCNQFGAQEPGTNSEIKAFHSTKYASPYPIMSKVDVNGPNTAEVYQFLKQTVQPPVAEISWNFAKFLVNSEGKVVSYHDPDTEPNSILDQIKALLNA
ncbi:hypothetical protein FGO68_gene9634 [Halteria grandinella]|uniref:Glutathione peroxidase n=1 Tax=Halteria grandinella TaxID=5974 RepID=A0A8J8NIX7_HALGN|nr:hypothetical protein FGO68_gene9634 [Halteria grandinella]